MNQEIYYEGEGQEVPTDVLMAILHEEDAVLAAKWERPTQTPYAGEFLRYENGVLLAAAWLQGGEWQFQIGQFVSRGYQAPEQAMLAAEAMIAKRAAN